jgi:two-component system nitrate/nitrite response regulator NarL
MTASGLREILEGEPLTDREIEMLYGMALGDTAQQHGEKMHLGKETIRSHRKNAIAKLGARNSAHAVALAIGKGILNIQIIMDEHEGRI